MSSSSGKTYDELFAENPVWNQPMVKRLFETCARAVLMAQDGVDAMERSRGVAVPTRRERLAQIMAALAPPSLVPVVPVDPSVPSVPSVPPVPSVSRAAKIQNSNRNSANKTKKRKTELEDLCEVWDSNIVVSGKRPRRTCQYSK